MNYDKANSTGQNSSGNSDGISFSDGFSWSTCQRIADVDFEYEIPVVLLPLRADERREAMHQNV